MNVATSGGTATPGVNYTPVNQVVNFGAGQSSQSITVPVKDAGNLSQAMTVNVTLSNPGGGASLGTPSTATVTILNAGQSTGSGSLPPPVTLGSVQEVKKNHKISEIVLGFSGALNGTQAASVTEYGLVTVGKKGSFTGKGAKALKLKSAVYNSANNTVDLFLKKPTVFTKKVQLTVDGLAPSGLEDTYGRLIDGNDDGQPGGNAVAILTKNAATITAVRGGSVVDALLASGELTGLTKVRKN